MHAMTSLPASFNAEGVKMATELDPEHMRGESGHHLSR